MLPPPRPGRGESGHPDGGGGGPPSIEDLACAGQAALSRSESPFVSGLGNCCPSAHEDGLCNESADASLNGRSCAIDSPFRSSIQLSKHPNAGQVDIVFPVTPPAHSNHGSPVQPGEQAPCLRNFFKGAMHPAVDDRTLTAGRPETCSPPSMA